MKTENTNENSVVEPTQISAPLSQPGEETSKVAAIFLSIPAVWTGWVLGRLVIGYLTVLNTVPLGDVYYYFLGVYGDDPTAMTEYPHAGTWPSFLLARLIGDNPDAYLIAFPVMMLCIDALFMSLLLRRNPAYPGAISAAWAWVFFGTAVGPVFLLRLDLFPALLVALAGYFLFKHPALSASALAFAAAMKLWPAILAAALVGSFKQAKTWLALLSLTVSSLLFAVITVLTKGEQRLTSPLEYQQVRGLQIESVVATPFIVRNFFHPGTWEIAYAPSKSFEITGPGVEQAISVANLCMLLTLLFALFYSFYRFIFGSWRPESSLVLFVTLVVLLLVSNKVFSPQYITWLGPILVMALSHKEWPRGQRTLIWTLTVLAIVCGALSTMVFPFGYSAIWDQPGTDFLPVLALATRNALVIAMAPLCLAWLYLSSRKKSGKSD